VVSTNNLWACSASELAHAYAGGDCSPADVIDCLAHRIETINPHLNAFVTLDLEGARAAAVASEARWRAGAPLSALDGVPVSIKDNLTVGGMRSTWGSALYAQFVPDADELPVARLRAAGALILGKTNCPELTVHGYTDNLLFGVTRNPWDTALTPGGVKWRRGRCSKRGARTDRAGHRRRRFDPQAGIVHGPCGTQAFAWQSGSREWLSIRPPRLRGGRPDRTNGRRHAARHAGDRPARWARPAFHSAVARDV
jgi:Amidase